MALGAVLGFGLTVLVSRWLGPRRAGGLFELIAMFTILSNTLELGADTGLTRWISRARAVGGLGRVRRIMKIALVPVLIIGAATAIVMWFVAPLLAPIFLRGMDPATAVRDIRIVAPLVPIGALSNCVLAGPRGYDRMWPYLAVEGFGKPAARLVLVLVALLLGWGLTGALVAWSLPVVVGLVASWVIMIKIMKLEGAAARRSGPAGPPVPLRAGPTAAESRPGPAMLAPAAAGSGRHRAAGQGKNASRKRLAKEFWGFAAPRGFAGAFQIVVIWLDVLLVGALVSQHGAGIYSAVSKLALVGTYALAAQRLAIGPQLSALLARRQYWRAEDLFQGATRLLMLVSFPLYIALAIFPKVVLGIFGANYTSGATALCILATAMLVNLGTGNVTVVLLMGGKSSWNALNAAAALTVNVGLNLILLPRIGISGAAIAWAASIVVDNVLAVIEVRWKLGLATFGPGYSVALVATVGCFGLTGLVGRIFLGQTLPSMALAVAVGVMAYGAFVYLARGQLHIGEFFVAMKRRGAGAAPSQPDQQAA